MKYTPAVIAMPVPGKAEYQLVDRFAAQAMPALAHHVADVAEHEQVAGEHAGGARDILGLTGDEAARKTCRLARRPRGILFGGLDFRDQRRRDRHAALGSQLNEASRKLGVAGGQRFLDLARRGCRVELLVQCEVSEPHRIVRRHDCARGIDAIRHTDGACDCETHGKAERQCDGETG